MLAAGFILAPAAALGFIAGLFHLVFSQRPELWTVLPLVATLAVELGVIVLWVRNYHIARMRLRGWVAFRKDGRQQYHYVEKRSQTFAPDAWRHFFRGLGAELYPICDPDGHLVTRQVYADMMHTSVGLVNDLYPLNVDAEIDAMLRHLTNRAAVDATRASRKQVRQLYTASGWLPLIHMYTSMQDMQKLHAVRTSAAFATCVAALVVNCGMSKVRAIALVDDMTLAHVMVHGDNIAQALTDHKDAFSPDELRRLLPNWLQSYRAVFQAVG